jgi:hypothetical protein
MQMRFVVMLSSLVLSSVAAHGQQRTPKLTSTGTPIGKRGDVIAFSGENLGIALLQEVYLTDGQRDFQVVAAEQTSTTFRFRIPEEVPAGRFAFMALTAGKDPKFIALPRFKMTIDQHGGLRIDDSEREIRASCSLIYRNTAEKKVGDLTVNEEQQVRRCQGLGLYPPK